MKITESIHAIKHVFLIPVSPKLNLERFVYSFIIFGKKGIYLIDSGVADSGDKILNYITEKGYAPRQINAILLTHSHPDHIGSAAYIKQKSGCKILMHKNETHWIENIEKQFKERPVPGFTALVNRSAKVDKLLEHNQRIELEENLVLRVIHTPGHSSGSLSFFMEDQKALFCGDALLLPGALPIYDNPFEAVSSIQLLKKIKNPRFLLSSWDEVATGEDIHLKMDQSISYYQSIHQSIMNIEDNSSKDPMELCEQLVDQLGLPPAANNLLVANAFQAHLQAPEKELLEAFSK